MQNATPRMVKSESKKENKDVSKGEFKKPAKIKPPMRFGVESVRKETNKKTDSPVKRTQSVQNVAQALSTVKSSSKGSGASSTSKDVIKRAQSSQNVSGQKNARLSAPSNAMAYNAELLANFEKEKKVLERRISELIKTSEDRQRDNEKLKYEVKNLKTKLKDAKVLLKDQQKQNNHVPKSQTASPSHEGSDELAVLRRENSSLRQKLKELNSCLDDQEGSDKTSSRKHKIENRTDSDDSKNKSVSDLDCKCVDCFEHNASSCPEKRSTISLDCWERQSNKSGEEGEVSLHCLQDRILQMQENHYSTNEELQATLQELNDLQKAVNDLTDENEKLANERHVLLESLCSQTEKLENSRLHVEFVKSLLLGDGDLGGSRSENERQLLSLVKSAQEEREELLLRQVEMSNCMQVFEKEAFEAGDLIEVLQSSLKACQKELEETTKLKQVYEMEGSAKEEELDQTRLEFEKLKISQERDQRKISQMEEERRLLQEKSELTSLIDLLRGEKEDLSSRMMSLEQQLSEKKFEVGRLQEVLAETKEQLRTSSNRADNKMSQKVVDLEAQGARLRCRVTELQEELNVSHKHIDSLRIDCESHIDEKKTHTLMLARTESELRICKSKTARAELELKETREKFAREQDDWLQFQQDLQRAVVIANEFKTEAQEDMERVSVDFSRKQEQVMILNKELNLSKTEIDHLKQQLASTTQQCQQLQQQLQQQQQQFAASFQQRNTTDWMSREDFRDKVFGDRVSRRHSRLHDYRQQQHPQLSVRNLISSIEQQMQDKSTISPGLLASSTPPCGLSTGTSSAASSVCGASGVAGPISPPSNSNQVKNSPLSSRLSSANQFLRRPASNTNEDNPSASKLKSLPLNLLPTSLAIDDANQTTIDNSGRLDNSNGNSNTPSNAPGNTSPQTGKKQLMGILNKSHRRETTDGSADHKITSTPSSLTTTTTNSTATSTTPTSHLSKTDPLANLAKQLGGSKRNALLKWCQNKTATYEDIDITNFSSSWNDGMAFCALLHTYIPHLIPYHQLSPDDKINNFTLAFKGAENVGIPSTLDIVEMAARERPDWQSTMAYVTSIYKHFEVSNN